jgi:hypothetical protein
MNVKRLSMVVLFGFLFSTAGCAISDVLFAAFGDYYSEGGYTRVDREYHYRRQLEATRNYDRMNPTSMAGLDNPVP